MCAAYLLRNVLVRHLILYRDTSLINIGFHSWEAEQNVLSSPVRGTAPLFFFLRIRARKANIFGMTFINVNVKVKVNQSRYRPEVAQKVPGS